MNIKVVNPEWWKGVDQVMNERQSPGLQTTPLSIVIDAKPSYAELEDMSEFERARHTSKTWSMGQD
jgi:hypothetical protein